jgi:hypothetical protein
VLPNSALLTDAFHSALRAARGAAKRERWAPSADAIGSIVRQCLVPFLIAASLSSCAPARMDRGIVSSDLIFGRLPASETVLRVKAPCFFALSTDFPPSLLSPGGARSYDIDWFLPVGDFIPTSADSNGIFYTGPEEATVPAEYLRPGRGAPSLALGIYFPFEAGANSPLLLWSDAVSVEWGTSRRVKGRALPERCWQPYGTAMAIVHNGMEAPSR